MLPACSASALAGIPSASRPVPDRSQSAACPVIFPPASCPGPSLGSRRHFVLTQASAPAGISSGPRPLQARCLLSLGPRRHFALAQASVLAGISSGPWPLRARCLPGDLVTGIPLPVRYLPPPAFCPGPSLGPRRHRRLPHLVFRNNRPLASFRSQSATCPRRSPAPARRL